MMKITFQSSFVRVSLFLVLAVTGWQGCKKEEEQPDIPYVYVNFSIDPNSIMYDRLNYPGGYEYLTGGYKGILVYRISMYDFVAYERACPYDPLVTGSRIEVDTSMITCYCPVCMSNFIITDGTVVSGPTHWPLKQYETVYRDGILYIMN